MRHMPLIAALLLALAGSAQATGFTYRGQLDDGGRPAEGSYRLKLTLYADPAGVQPLAAPLILDQVTVAGGRFAVGVDFPELPDQIASGWLEVAVMAEDESDFWPLPEKQPVVLKAQLCPESWALAGNASTNPAVNFLGTTDSQPLVLRTRNAQSLRIEPSSELLDGLPITANVVAGSHANAVAAGVRGATIAGGGMPGGNSDPQFIESSPNLVSDHYGGVGGGYGNRAGDSAGTPSDAAFAYVGGGRLNTASSPASTVSGGAGNSASGTASAIGGGWANTASGTTSAVGGGFGNLAGGSNSAVSGGEFNVASNAWSTVAGGWGNTASGIYSAVPGGRNNCAGGLDSWAGGHNAKVRPHADPFDGFACSGLASYPGGDGDRGTFVWADSQGGVFVSSGANQFLVRATGGMALNGLPINDAVELNVVADNDGPNYANLFLRQRDFNAGILVSAGDATGTAANDAGFYLDQFNGSIQARRLTLASNGDFTVTAAAFKPGGGSWSASSDIRLKEGIEPLSGALERLLKLRGVSFDYREPDPARRPAGRRIGFVAQEVQPLFPDWVGQDDQGYLTVGSQGFEALTVEALRELRAENAAALVLLEAENAALRRELASLREQQEALHARLADLHALLLPAMTRRR